MKTARLNTRLEKWNRRLKIVSISRSEVGSRSRMPRLENAVSWRELDQWLLWAGIAPEAGMPVSHIGIYTDFT